MKASLTCSTDQSSISGLPESWFTHKKNKPLGDPKSKRTIQRIKERKLNQRNKLKAPFFPNLSWLSFFFFWHAAIGQCHTVYFLKAFFTIRNSFQVFMIQMEIIYHKIFRLNIKMAHSAMMDNCMRQFRSLFNANKRPNSKLS